MSDARDTLIEIQAELGDRLLQILIEKRPELLDVGAALLETTPDDPHAKAFFIRACLNVMLGSFWDLVKGYTKPDTSYADLRHTVLTLFSESIRESTEHHDTLADFRRKPVEGRPLH